MRLLFHISYYQVTNLRKAFVNNSSTTIKLSQTQVCKIIQSGGFLDRLLGTLPKVGLPLMKNVLEPLAKRVLISLRLTTAASPADARVDKRILGSGDFSGLSQQCRDLRAIGLRTTTLIISNKEMEVFIKIVKSIEDFGL